MYLAAAKKVAALGPMHYCTRRSRGPGQNKETVIHLSTARRSALKIAFTALTLTLLYLTLRGREDLSGPVILQAVQRFRPGNAFLAALLSAAQIFFMIPRMYVLCPSRPLAPLREVTFAVAVGHSVNMFFPARAGEALKVLWLGRAGGTDEGYLARGIGWLLADRLADLSGFAILILTTGVLTLPAFRDTVPFSLWWIPLGIAVLLVLMGLFSFASTRLHAKLQTWMKQLTKGMSGISYPGHALLGVLAGLAGWCCEIAALGILTASQGYSLDIAQLFFVLVVLNLAIAVPITVANVGPFEASIAFALKFFDVPMATGIAIAGTHHLLQLFGVAGWALVAMAWRRGKAGKLSITPS